MDISGKYTLDIAKVCLGFATNDVQSPSKFFYLTFKIYHIIALVDLSSAHFLPFPWMKKNTLILETSSSWSNPSTTLPKTRVKRYS